MRDIIMNNNISLKQAIQMQQQVQEYSDSVYIEMIEKLNRESKEIMKPDLGNQFVKSCGKDIAGEIVRNFFNTSDYHITVDQLAMRIIKFKYDDDYDPIKQNKDLQKRVYNQNDALLSVTATNFDTINQRMQETMNSSKSKLFNKETVIENGKERRKYEDRDLIEKGKRQYRSSRTDENGNIKDEYTGKDGDYHTDKNGKQ